MAKQCPKCQSSMIEGLIVDHDHGRRRVSKWVEGAPERNFLFGVKIRGKTQIEIQAFRCARCGFLENYAPN
jgi:predicted nucleic-acid-binding Zn-ribbon protein